MTSRSDNFTAADNATSLSGRVPSDGGSAWVVTGGAFGIRNNGGYQSSGAGTSANLAYLESGSSIGKISFTLSALTRDISFILRCVDSTNYVRMTCGGASTSIDKVVGGTLTTLNSVGGYTNGDVIEFSVDAANVYRIKRNGTTAVTSAADSAGSTGTKVGFRCFSSTCELDTFTFTDESPSTFDADDQTADSIVQQISGSRAKVFSGITAGTTPTDIQVQLYAADGTTVLQAWTPLTSATISSTNWSGTLNVPAGGMYRFAARSRNGGGTVLFTSAVKTNLWGVGLLFSMVGSSSAEKWGDSSSGTGLTANTNVRKYSLSNTWGAAGTVGASITLANSLNTLLSMPVGIVCSGAGGSTLNGWSSGDGNYSNWLADLSAVGGKLGLIMSIVGLNDVSAGIVSSKASHATKLRTLFSNMRTAAGQSALPILIFGTQGFTSSNNDQADYIRGAELDVATDVNNYLAATSIDRDSTGDGIHLTAADYGVQLVRGYKAISSLLGTPSYYRGPKVSGFTASGTTGTVTITPNSSGTNLAVAASTGFTASDGSGALTVSSASVTNPTTIGLVFGRTISGAVTLKYGSGARPIAPNGGVHDNTALALPLEPLTDGITTSTMAIAGVDFTVPMTLSNGVTISGGNLNIPAGVTSFTATLQTLVDDLVESPENVNLTVGGVVGVGTILDGDATLSPLTEVGAVETPYGLLDSTQRTNTASGGGYPLIYASRNNLSSPNFAVYSSTTEGGTYTLLLDNQAYTPSALVNGYMNFDHRLISINNEIDFPSTILTNTAGLIADTTGQKEFVQLNGVTSRTVAGETIRVLENVGVAIFDSVPIKVSQDETARVFSLASPSISNTMLADGVTRYYKIVPKNSSGDSLSLAGITPISLTIGSVARKPYPPRNVGFGGFSSSLINFPQTFINNDGSAYIKMFKSSRLDETTPSSFFNPSATLESGVTLHVDVTAVDSNTVIRTLNADGAGLATYSKENRATDISRTATKYVAYAMKGGIKSAPWSYIIRMDNAYDNRVSTVNAVQSTTNIVATVALTATAADPAGTGQETFLALINIKGTLFDNVNMDSITVNNSCEIFDINKDTGDFFIQGARDLANFVLTIPFVGGTGDTLTVGAGRRDNLYLSDDLTFSSVTTV